MVLKQDIRLEDQIGPCFTRADNGKMRASNESYAHKMNIIVILVYYMNPLIHAKNLEKNRS